MKRNERLRGKTVVITGASGGLGEQIAYRCAQNGANLFLLARNGEKITEMAKQMNEQYNVICRPIIMDISHPEQISDVFKQIYEFGEIDVLVNNAGYGVFAEVEDVKLADVEGMFSVNVTGLIACTKEVVPHMRKRKLGHIINIGSQAGKLATPKSSIYAATKHAVLGFTNSLRLEMSRYGVYVTAINPGPIRTNFFQTADPSGAYLANVHHFALDSGKVAERIVHIMLTNRREINLPYWMNLGSIVHTLIPSIVERLGRKAFFKK